MNKRGCPFCRGLRVSTTNSLAVGFPDVAAEWHPTKNIPVTPNDVIAGSEKKYWWRCSRDPAHEWHASVSNRTRVKSGCPHCRNLIVGPRNSLAARFPEIAAEWHPTRNGEIKPEQVIAGSAKPYWWKCPKGPDHEWQAKLSNRTSSGKRGCPFCAGRRASITNSLPVLYPEIAAQWHQTRNRGVKPDQVASGSAKKYWWKCPAGVGHEWEAAVVERTTGGKGCPRCGKGWTVSAIRGFIASLVEHLESFTPAELYLLFQQNGLLDATGRGRGFVKALTTGRFPVEELEKFVGGTPSLVDEFVADSAQTLESLQDSPSYQESVTRDAGTADALVDESAVEDETDLPVVEAKDVLGSLTSAVVTTADAEAVEFLVASACGKLWRHAFRHEDSAVKQAEAFVGEGYADRVRSEFLAEYRRAHSLKTPAGYAFRIDGKLTLPNLMQRLAASRLVNDRRVGNWSGTGAGKTLSAVLASRVVDAKLTVICCPNSVVGGWKDAILGAFPDSKVETKTFRPQWGATRRKGGHRYLILNYEAFQQADSGRNVRAFVGESPIDFIVVDEIHFTKQREVEKMSQRKRHVAALIAWTYPGFVDG
jgi:hypothetical protein